VNVACELRLNSKIISSAWTNKSIYILIIKSDILDVYECTTLKLVHHKCHMWPPKHEKETQTEINHFANHIVGSLLLQLWCLSMTKTRRDP